MGSNCFYEFDVFESLKKVKTFSHILTDLHIYTYIHRHMSTYSCTFILTHRDIHIYGYIHISGR